MTKSYRLSRCLQKILLISFLCVSSILFSVQNLILPTKVFAAPNYQINYQGKLTNTANIAVPDGTYHMRFWLNPSPTASNIGAVWSEDRSTAPGNRVVVRSGLFSVMLGSSTPLTNVDFNQTLYLGVEIGGSAGTASWDGEMTPRKILGTVPAAFEANKIDGLDSIQFLRSDTPTTLATSSASTLLTITQNGTGDILNIYDGANQVFTVLDGGRVGIGTTTPGQLLSVNGNAFIGGNLQATGTLALSGAAALSSTLNVSGLSTLSTLSLTSGTSTNFYTENLGVNSEYFTDLTGAGLVNINGALSVSTSSLALDTTYFKQGGNSFGTTALLGTNDNNSLALETNGSAKLTILSGGNVGIGITTPGNIFEVSANSSGTALSTTTLIAINNSNSTAGTNSGIIFSQISGGLNGSALLGVQRSRSAGSRISDLAFYTYGQATIGSMAESMRIAGDTGNLGIGTTSPSARLAITGGGTGTGRAFVIANSANAEKFTVFDNGNVGIGTTSPSQTLSVGGNSLISGNATTNGEMIGTLGSGNGQLRMVGTGNYGAILRNDGTNLFLLFTDSGTPYGGFNSLRPFTVNNANGSVTLGTTTINSHAAMLTTATIGGTDNRGTLTVQKIDNSSAYIPNSDMGDGGRYFVMENNSTTNAANQFANITMQVNPFGGLGSGRVLGDIRYIRDATSSTNAYYLFSGFRNEGYRDFTRLGYDKSYFVSDLGIGTTTPSARFAITASSTSATDRAFAIADSANSEKLTVLNNGFLGLGTTTPSARFAITASSTGTGRAFAIANSANAEKFTVLDNGNVGIGSTTPASLLTLSAPAPTLDIVSSSGSISMIRLTEVGINGLYMRYNGSNSSAAIGIRETSGIDYDAINIERTTRNVGIGTSSPAERLSVSGNGLFAGNLQATNITATGTATIGSLTGIVKGTSGLLSTATLGTDYINNSSINTSSELLAILGDETGTGSLVFSTSPTLVTPNLGTPSAVTLTNGTGLPISTGVSGLGTGIATFLGTPTSANLATALTDESGSGAAVFGTFTSQTLGDLMSWNGSNWVNVATSTLGFGSGTVGGGTTGQIPYYAANGTTLIATSSLFIAANGNVGIGTTSPSYNLSVAGNGLYSGTLAVGSVPAGAYELWVKASAGNGDFGVASADGNSWSFSTINGTGSFGFFDGTNQSMTLEKGAPSNSVYLKSNGFFGLGTTTPGQLLSVNGNAFIGGNLQATGTLQVTGLSTLSTLSLTSGTSTNFYTANLGVNSEYFTDLTGAGLVNINGALSVSTTTLNLGNNSFIGLSDTDQTSFIANRIVHTNAAGTGLTDTAGFVFTGTNLGVGSTTPTYLLSVNGGTNNAIKNTKAFFGRSDSAVGVEIGTGDGTANAGFIGSATNAPFFFTVNSTERARFDTSGNFGIGTTTPGTKLDVYGTLRTTDSTAGAYLQARTTSGGVGVLETSIGSLQLAPFTGTTRLTVSGTNSQLQIDDSSGAGQILFRTSGSPSYINTGNVGIGTTTPGEKLSVYGGDFGIQYGQSIRARANTDSSWVSGTTKLIETSFANSEDTVSLYTPGSIRSNAVMTLKSSGNVGIGTTTPYRKLSVTDTSAAQLALAYDTANSTQFQTNSAGNLLITPSGGRIGIGTTSPSAPLSVVGNVVSTGQFLADGTVGAPAFSSVSNPTTGFYWLSSGTTGYSQNGSTRFVWGGDQNMGSGVALNWKSASTGNGGSTDVTLSRASAGVLQLGTTAANALGSLNLTNLIASGNVGIGTTTPIEKLSILSANNSAATNVFAVRSANLTQGIGIGFDTIRSLGTNGNVNLTLDTAGTGNLTLGTGGASRLTIDGTSGSVGIGTTTPVSTLSIQGSLCVRDTGTCGTTPGTIYATTATLTDIDLAENYHTSDKTLTAAEIVTFETGTSSTIKRARRGDTLVGVVSTAPGLLLGQSIKNSKPVALKGRVPLRVNMEGGVINPGDAITISSVPGVGTKATTTTQIVGLALEKANQNGFIEVYVENRMYLAENHYEALNDIFALGETGSTTALTLTQGSFVKGFFSQVFAQVTEWLSDATNGIGSVFAKSFRAEEEICVDDQCLTGDDIRALLEQVNNNANTQGSNTGGGGDQSGGGAPSEPEAPQGEGGGGVSNEEIPSDQNVPDASEGDVVPPDPVEPPPAEPTSAPSE